VAEDTTYQVDYVELVAAILLGVAATAIAWSTYQSALWGGIQDEGYTESVREASNAVDPLQAADRIRALDQLVFVEMRTAGVCEAGEQSNDVVCEQLLESMSDEGRSAVAAAPAGANPFELPTHIGALSAQGEAAQDASNEFFRQAGEANNHGDNHELAATILTAVLFFAGIATVLDDRHIAWSLIAVAGVLLIAGVVYSITLPLA
jgi:hypothetical protein